MAVESSFPFQSHWNVTSICLSVCRSVYPFSLNSDLDQMGMFNLRNLPKCVQHQQHFSSSANIMIIYHYAMSFYDSVIQGYTAFVQFYDDMKDSDTRQ